MKNSIRITVVFALALSYCLAIGVVSNSVIFLPAPIKQKSDNAAFIGSASLSLFNYAGQKENRVNSHVYYQLKDYKDTFTYKNVNSKVLSLSFKREIRQYIQTTVDFLLQKKISTLIFPFNYFW